jgi:SAM-dependent methyltransferase
MQTIERIYPKQLDPACTDDQNTLRIHLERYQFAAQHAQGLRILDMACGCGYGTFFLAQQHPDKHVTGVDLDPNAVAYAEQHYQRNNLQFICANAEQFSVEQPFDTIVSLETIEHLPNSLALVKSQIKLLSATGRLIASVPITPTLDGNPHHLHDFSRSSFLRLFSTVNLRSIEHFEQIQYWQFKGLFSAKPDLQKKYRSQGVGNAIVRYYIKNPLYLLKRLHSMLRYGFSNRYLTCVFIR